jgi:predicted transcriptional regulator of viral defense system
MSTPRIDARRKLAQLAATRSGYFSAADALEAGYSYRAQADQTKRGNWERIQHGIYRLADAPAGDHDDLVRWSLWSHDQGVVSHDTALSVYRLGDANPAVVHLTVPKQFRKTSTGIRLHRATLDDSDVNQSAGFRITTPVRTIVDVAATTTDADVLNSAIDDALDQGLVTTRQLVHVAAAHGPTAELRIERALRTRDSK